MSAGGAGLDGLDATIVHHVVNTLGWPGLRPLQEQAIEPIRHGRDVLALAPTAGGKTEAASFPLLSQMAADQWRGISVLYVCPLKALLNNLQPRLDTYAQWIGRRAALWHGDTGQSARQRLLVDPPDILLTTPESLEAMLVSTKVDHTRVFADLRAIVVDEVHAFAGDDRGWHLLAVLERLERVAGRPIQRIGLSATVGNPDELLTWLQGSHAGRPSSVVAPDVAVTTLPPPGEITLDHVGSLDGAATVIAALHAGEKRLVFCESRREVEELAHALREREVTTFVSHSSLALDERRRAEQAFAEARDCVIVSTSTLELGIDVGDLDRVIQINAPRTVASFLQRLGRTGRRPGSVRNALFLTTREDGFLRAAALLLLWSRGYVEPVVAPPSPRHIAAQQVLALCLQEGRVGENTWREAWGDIGVFDEHADEIVEHLVSQGLLERDQGMLFIGQEAEQRYGRRHFMDLLAVFTAKPEFSVIAGRADIGSVDPIVLTRKVEGPRILVLAGRSWQVTHIDWKRRRCFVEPSDQRAAMTWMGESAPLSYALSQAHREVLLGSNPSVRLSKRALATLEELRESQAFSVTGRGLVLEQSGDDVWWWTYAGGRANATLMADLPDVVDQRQRLENFRLRVRLAEGQSDFAIDDFGIGSSVFNIEPSVVRALKFAELLPIPSAVSTAAARGADDAGARMVREMRRFRVIT